MEESILISIKKLLGQTKEYTHFDTDIIIHINTAFMDLNQIGLGPDNGFRIEDDTNTWDEFLQDSEKFDAVKTYIYLKVKLVFDPPLNSAVLEATKQSLTELLWRLNVQAESK